MRRRVFTDEVIKMIPDLVAKDYKAEAIAAHLGCNVSTLKVRCSQLKISLRTPSWRKRWRGETPAVPDLPKVVDVMPRELPTPKRRPFTMNSQLTLSRVALARLRQAAELMNMSDVQLATALLETIAQDDLYGAVLDNQEKAA